MNQRSSNRLERRSERAGRRPGATPPPSRRRSREPQRVGRSGGTGFLPFSPMALAVAGGIVAIVLILGYLVVQAGKSGSGEPDWLKAQLNSDSSIPGLYVKPHPGADGKFGTSDDREHFAPGTTLPICSADLIAQDAAISDPYADRSAVKDCYTSNPPTSGRHSSTPQGFSNQQNPAPKENILHSMEHGGVYIWYNTSNAEAVELVKSLVNENTDRRRFVGSTIYTQMEPETIAITSWTRLDKFPVSELTKKRLQDFINENHKRFNPEGF